MSRAQLTSTVEQNTGGAVAPLVAGKNLIANGGMDYFQRGTSLTATGYGADRWYQTVVGTCTVSQDTDVPVGSGMQYSLKFTSGAASSYANYAYSFEQGQIIPLRGQLVSISWYSKANSTLAGDFKLTNIYYSNTTDARASQSTAVSFSGTFTAIGTTWVRKTATVTIPSDAVGLQIQFNNTVAQASGSVAWLTGVQMELGPVATPFSRAGGTLSGELALCQRYYWRSTTGYNYGFVTPFCGSAGNSTTVAYFTIPIPVPMRLATPTSIDYSNIGASDGANIYTGSWGISTSSTIYPMVYVNTTGLVNYRPLMIQANNSSTAYFGLSAEL